MSDFGFVDHFWHGKLFLVGPDWIVDMALGLVIVLATVALYGIMLALPKVTSETAKA